MNDLQKAETIDNIITHVAPNFVSTISKYQWNIIPDSQLHAAKQALTKSDYIMNIACENPTAVHDSLVQAAILGVDLTQGKNQAWLVPRKNQQGKTVIQLQVGYKGVEAIHQRMGVIDRLVVRAVRENDTFEWSGDDQEKPKHEADWFADEETRGKFQGAYAITYYPDGSINVTAKGIEEIYKKHRDFSDSWKSYRSKLAAWEASGKKGNGPFAPPWLTHEQAMIEKTMAYIASKQWPANIRDEGMASKILETLHEVDAADYSFQYTAEQRDYFHKFIDKDDSLGIYLFSKHIDVESWVALFNTFPRGTKTERKAHVRNMEDTGQKILSEILDAIEHDDEGRIAENLEDCLDATIKLLIRRLDSECKAKVEHALAGVDAA